ncbi:head GIN domain-containing protein [Spirosoma gilvum]
MTRTNFLGISHVAIILSLSGCSFIREDVGPYQTAQQSYALTNFDRLDMGSAFVITVQQGPAYSITVEGDSRNLDDLDVYTRNGTLKALYRVARNRQYATTFRITMPSLRGVDFSGAVRSTVTGFTNLDAFDINLSGASEGQFIVQAARSTIDLSGATILRLSGQGTTLTAVVSGASLLQAFDYPVDNAGLDLSGASKANVSVNSNLAVKASGASAVRYRGKPTIVQRVSGASTVQNEL